MTYKSIILMKRVFYKVFSIKSNIFWPAEEYREHVQYSLIFMSSLIQIKREIKLFLKQMKRKMNFVDEIKK